MNFFTTKIGKIVKKFEFLKKFLSTQKKNNINEFSLASLIDGMIQIKYSY